MKRRTLAHAAAAALCAPMVGCAASGATQGAPWVLVHGAWHGAWCWQPLVEVLERRGQHVIVVSLPGVGERAAELGPQVDLITHVDAVVEAVRSRGENRVRLLGHSYAGFVISGALAPLRRQGGAVDTAAYLDAFVPRPGERVADYLPPDAATRLEAQLRQGDAGYAPPPPGAFGIVDPALAAWVQSRLTPHPIGSYFTPLQWQPEDLPADRRYIRCTAPALPVFAQTAARLRDDPRWRYAELATGHDAMLTAPQALADLLTDR